MTRVVCVSDLHENLPDIPDCDLLVVAGDITFGLHGDIAHQQGFIVNEFKEWLTDAPATSIAVVAGNHDQNVEQWGWPLEPWACEYLQDSGARLCGLNVWGTPWQPYFFNCGFNAPERHGEVFLKSKFDLIPDDTDILICHGPPYGYGDRVGNPHVEDRSNQPKVGSRALTHACRRVEPKLMVCGHIHSGRGVYPLHGKQTKVVNCSVVNNKYEMVYEPMVFDV